MTYLEGKISIKKRNSEQKFETELVCVGRVTRLKIKRANIFWIGGEIGQELLTGIVDGAAQYCASEHSFKFLSPNKIFFQ